MSGGREPQKNLEKVLKMAIENTPVGGDNAEVAPPREMSAEVGIEISMVYGQNR